jgi:Protein of unknown function (DUF3570)
MHSTSMHRRAVALLLVTGVVFAAGSARAEHSGSAAVYVREDTDHTTVISPRLRLRAPIVNDETHVDLAYSVDVWTSASVDIVASASQPVTEQRDELNAGVDHVFGDLTLGAAYRFSTEPDYKAHGGSIRAALDLANRAFTLAWTGGGSADRVGRAGDASFDKAVTTLTTGLSLTQVVDTETLVQLLYDFALVRGYQASAYRFVSFGSAGACRATAALCRPETNPRERLRHAIAVRARRALSTEWSVGAGYRAYLDDWGMFSNTVRADIAWAPQPKSTLALAYRFYDQSAAHHYKAQYQVTDLALRYFARDKELSPLTSHRVALELDWVWDVAGRNAGLVTALAAAATFYRYRDFSMLDRATAIEVTAAVGMEFE